MASSECDYGAFPGHATSSISPPSCKTSRPWRSDYWAHHPSRHKRRSSMGKARAPGQLPQMCGTSNRAEPTSCTQNLDHNRVFRQHRPIADSVLSSMTPPLHGANPINASATITLCNRCGCVRAANRSVPPYERNPLARKFQQTESRRC